MDWKGRGGVFCGISIIFVYLFTYLHIYIFTLLFGERCRSVALYLVVFIVNSVSTNIFLCFSCVCLLYPFGGGPCCISTQCLPCGHLGFPRIEQISFLFSFAYDKLWVCTSTSVAGCPTITRASEQRQLGRMRRLKRSGKLLAVASMLLHLYGSLDIIKIMGYMYPHDICDVSIIIICSKQDKKKYETQMLL